MTRLMHSFVVLAAIAAPMLWVCGARAEVPEDALMGCFQRSATQEEYYAIGDQMVGTLADQKLLKAAPLTDIIQRQKIANEALARLTTQACATETQAVIEAHGQNGLKFVLAELGSLSLTVRLDSLYRATYTKAPDALHP